MNQRLFAMDGWAYEKIVFCRGHARQLFTAIACLLLAGMIPKAHAEESLIYSGTSGTFNNTSDIGSDLSFSDLNLELWQVTSGAFVTIVAQSATIYNNTEFLRVDLPGAGNYGLRVLSTDWSTIRRKQSRANPMAWPGGASPCRSLDRCS